MKKIGFIDYYLDEWHANNYPALIEKQGEGKFAVSLAWGKIPSPISGMTNEEWSEKKGIPVASSIEEVVEKCDYIVVLSPDNPEMHEELSEAALKSGKPVYVDKSFSFESDAAKRMFETANEHGTPLCSASSLIFALEFDDVKKEDISLIRAITAGESEIHAIHEIEPIVYMLGGLHAEKVMFTGDGKTESFVIKFPENKTAMRFFAYTDFAFEFIHGDTTIEKVAIASPFMSLFVKGMLNFFETRIPFVDENQTIAVVEILEALAEAKKKPFEWVEIQK